MHRWFQIGASRRMSQRGGVVWISRRAHNPEIDGSNPSLATTNHTRNSHVLVANFAMQPQVEHLRLSLQRQFWSFHLEGIE